MAGRHFPPYERPFPGSVGALFWKFCEVKHIMILGYCPGAALPCQGDFSAKTVTAVLSPVPLGVVRPGFCLLFSRVLSAQC